MITSGETAVPVPNVWLRAFYGFDPWEAGYIGWTKEPDRNWMITNASDGDLILIYGAESDETERTNRRQLLGFLQIEITPVSDGERSSEYAKLRKVQKGWQDKWRHGLIVRRAWRIERRIEVGHLLPETYDPRSARFMGREQARLSRHEVEQVLQLPVTEVDVWGEASVGERGASPIRFELIFRPSLGITPVFGTRHASYEDGDHWLYLLRYNGDASAFIGRDRHALVRKAVVKIGYSNDVSRRLDEVNKGIPPKAAHRWGLALKSAPYPDGQSAKESEDRLKEMFNSKFESLGAEFFCGDENQMLATFASAPAVAQFTIRAVKKSD